MLVARCFTCHGPDKQEAGLRLDSREALLKGSDAAVVVVPGEPERSPIVHAVRYQGDVQMPPSGKLADNEVALMTTWVKMGVPWGGKSATVVEDMPARAVRGQSHALGVSADRPSRAARHSERSGLGAQPIDRFILAVLDKQGITHSPPADRRTLLRRGRNIDLLGLPVTAAEVDGCGTIRRRMRLPGHRSVSGFARIRPAVGALLARRGPLRGHQGLCFHQDRRFPYSYTYRDYVIRALNEDRPYDEFVRQQLAADLMNVADRRDLAAMGFLTVGRRFSNNIHDILDDRIDVVTRGLMGLTVTCARCHDHKYDPLPTDDYYSLYGIFASSPEPGEPPLIGEAVESEAYQKYLADLATREGSTIFATLKHRELVTDLRVRVKDYLCQVVIDTMKDMLPDDADLSFNPDELRPAVVRRWKQFLERKETQNDPVFGLWHEFGALEKDKYAEAAAAIVARLKAGGETPDRPLNPLVRERFSREVPESMLDVARAYGDLLAETEKSWAALQQSPPPAADGQPAKAPERLADDNAEQVRQALYRHAHPRRSLSKTLAGFWIARRRTSWASCVRSVDEIKINSPEAPPRAMVVNDAPTPHVPHVFMRGDPNRIGKEVPRQFVQFLAATPGQPYTQGSGRLELARAIASPDNPLTAASFGQSSVDAALWGAAGAHDKRFWTCAEPPTHPELLDFLARSFIDSGWSLKQLHRLIMLANTYQQSSADRPECQAVDAENRLLWRANRRRLDFESYRDSLLAAAGRLDPKLEGRLDRHLEAAVQHPPQRVRVSRSPRPAGHLSHLRFRQPRREHFATTANHGATAGPVCNERAICAGTSPAPCRRA